MKENLMTLYRRNENTFTTRKSLLNHFSFYSFFFTSVRYIVNNDIQFTEEEVKDFVSRHTTEEYDGVALPVENETTQGIKDYLLLTLYQGAALFSHEKASRIRDPLLFKYLETCKPEIFNNIPGFDHIWEDYLEKSQEGRDKVFLLHIYIFLV